MSPMRSTSITCRVSQGMQRRESLPGLVVGLADRLDSLAGLFAVGLAPSGTKDPFGQRRAALGVVGNLMEWNLDFDLRAALQAAAKHLPREMSPDDREDCLNFIIERQRNLLLEKGEPFDVIDAVLSVQGHNPNRASQAVNAFNGLGGTTGLEPDSTYLCPLRAHHARSRPRFTRWMKSILRKKLRLHLYDALLTAEDQ